MKSVTVAHICYSYLPLSETFIYRYLTEAQRAKPVILAGRIENAEQFPLTASIFDCSYRRYTFRWVLNKLGKHLMGDNDLYRRLLLNVNGAQLIHAHFGFTAYEALGLKKKTGLPMVTTFYGCDMSSLPNKEGWKMKYEELFSTGDLFLVEGRHMKKKLVELGCPEEKVAIQHIAIDTEQFAFRRRVPRGDGAVNLLFCGRFTEKKGLIYALRAYALVHKDFPNLRFRIVGDGEQRNQIEQFIRQNRLEDAVTLLGYQSHDAVASEMAQADILIHPSVTAANGDTEGGAPTIILEAQAAGVPVLATWHADIPEVTLPGQSALLSKEKDWEDLAKNLRYLVSHAEEWTRFGEAGRRQVEEHYDIRKEVSKLESKYLRLLGKMTSQ